MGGFLDPDCYTDEKPPTATYEYDADVDNLVAFFESEITKAAGPMQTAALSIFQMLALLELAVSVLNWWRSDDSGIKMLEKVSWKLVLIVLFASFIYNFDFWFPPIIDAFEGLGMVATDRDYRLNPANMMGTGVTWYFSAFTVDRPGFGMLEWLSPRNMSMYFTTGIVLLSFTVIAAQMTLIMVEASLAKAIGVFFVGFSAFRGTAQMADNFITYLMSLGTRLLLIYVMVGVWQRVMDHWAMSPSAIGQAWDFGLGMQIAVGSICMAILTFIIPNFLARKLTDNVQVGIASALWKLD